jgi:hypothetical protein
MAAGGQRTVKIRFTGESKGLDRAAKAAEKSVKSFGDKIQSVGAKAMTGLANLGSKAASALGDALMTGVKSLPTLAVGAALTSVLAPVIGAAISSAVLLAVGGGVLAAGIIAVAKTPKVKAAFGKLKDAMFDKDTSEIEKNIEAAQERFIKAQALGSKKGMQSARYDIEKAKKELREAIVFNSLNKSVKDMFKPFIEPLERAAKTFTQTFIDMKPAIERMAKVLAPVIDKLAPAIGDFFKKMLPGVEKAVKASVPLFETLAKHLPKIGEGIGLFFEQISANGDDANEFFDDLLVVITNIIVGLGALIGKLASWYTDLKTKLKQAGDLWLVFKIDVMKQLGALLDAAVKALSWIPGIGPKLKGAQKEFQKFQAEANKELQKIKDRNVSIRISTNIGQIAGEYANLVAGIINKGGKIGGKRASGGPVSAGRSYLVGERGPEVITMGSTNGNVTPNRELTGGGDVYEIHIDLGGDVKKVIRMENRDLKRRANARGALA